MSPEPSLPDGWAVVDEPGAPYVKYVKRDAATVPKRHAEGAAFQRDVVVLVTDDVAGVTKGPGARQSWQVEDPEAVGRALVDVLEEWTANDRDPYGASELDEQLADAAGEHSQQATFGHQEVDA